MPAPAQTPTLTAKTKSTHGRAAKKLTAGLAAAVVIGMPLVGISSAQAAPAAPSGNVSLSSLTPTSTTSPHGVIGIDVAAKSSASDPDRGLDMLDRSHPEFGDTMMIFGYGLGAHTGSSIGYHTGGNCSRLTSDIGILNGFTGEATFSVVGDGQVLHQSAPILDGAPGVLDVDISGIAELELKVAPSANGIPTSAVWGGPELKCALAPTLPDTGPTEPTEPTEPVEPVEPTEPAEPVEPDEPVDTQAPRTFLDATSGTLVGEGWYATEPTMALTAEDNVAVTLTEYRFDDEWITYTGEFTAPEGANTIEYRSSDAAGNVEDSQYEVVQVDTVAPAISATVYDDDRLITFEASDAGSGVESIESSDDGGTTWDILDFDGASANLGIGGDAVSTAYRATDFAGNITTSTENAVIPAADYGDDTVDLGDGKPDAPDPIAPPQPEPVLDGDHEFILVPVGAPEKPVVEKVVEPKPFEEPEVKPVVEEPQVEPQIEEPKPEVIKPIAEEPAVIVTTEEQPIPAITGARSVGAAGFAAGLVALGGGLIAGTRRLRRV